MKTGTELITEERQRQISQEGWTAEHDDAHWKEDLALAAACYVLPHNQRASATPPRDNVPKYWPWSRDWWKPARYITPELRVRELVKAGALIAAEIDRLQRLQPKP